MKGACFIIGLFLLSPFIVKASISKDTVQGSFIIHKIDDEHLTISLINNEVENSFNINIINGQLYSIETVINGTKKAIVGVINGRLDYVGLKKAEVDFLPILGKENSFMLTLENSQVYLRVEFKNNNLEYLALRPYKRDWVEMFFENDSILVIQYLKKSMLVAYFNNEHDSYQNMSDFLKKDAIEFTIITKLGLHVK